MDENARKILKRQWVVGIILNTLGLLLSVVLCAFWAKMGQDCYQANKIGWAILDGVFAFLMALNGAKHISDIVDLIRIGCFIL